MTIAIDISAGRNGRITDRFHFQCFSRLATEHPSHHFIFIFDSHPDPELYLESNCTPVIVSPVMKNSLLRHYWYNYKIPSILERYNADIFVTAGSTCSLRTEVPQCMIIESISLSDKKTGSYWKKFLPSFLKKANSICVTNPIVTEELIKKYGASPGKLTLIHPGTGNDAPAAENEKEEIRTLHTIGRDFFFFEDTSAGSNQLITMLKAFTIFKKWQQSGMQLVIAMKAPPDAELSKQLSLYKYIQDVHIINVESGKSILPAAYAAIMFDEHTYPSTALSAARAGIPLILSESHIFRKFFDDSPIYTGSTEADIASKMMLLYKDEHLRHAHIAKGINITSLYSWANTTSELWTVLISNANK